MGKYLTVEERLKVLELKKQGMPQKDIAKVIGRSASAVSYLINKGEYSVLRMKVDAEVPQLTKDAMRPKDKDLSLLPDNVFFKEVKWAIPIMVILLFSSCFPARDPSTAKFWKHGKVIQRMTARNYNHCKIYYDHFDNPIPFK